MEQFKMACPKCGSYSYRVERDPRNYAQRGQVTELIFSCRCGKQIFGEQIQEENDRQKAFWDTQMATPSSAELERRTIEKEKVDRQAALRAAYEYQASFLTERRKADAEAARIREETRLREWRERVARLQDPTGSAIVSAPPALVIAPAPTPEPAPPPRAPVSNTQPATAAEAAAQNDEMGVGHCEWEGCVNTVRAGSKYCSRECSNKNARWRHKNRVKPSAT